MAMTTKRGSSDDADLVKLYLRDIGRYPLLTKDDEAQLAQAMEAGREAEMALTDPGLGRHQPRSASYAGSRRPPPPPSRASYRPTCA